MADHIAATSTSGASANKRGARFWVGHILAALLVLFLLFDSITKLILVPQVVQAGIQLGFTRGEMQGIGVVLLICVILYVIPVTSVLGTILLTGYLGGATATQVHSKAPLFETLFPVIFGVLVWGGPFLRDAGLRDLIPLRKK